MINLVLYFDYEREFGNPAAKASAETGFRFIVETLDRFNIKATWNCVGLIAEKYPDTLQMLVDRGHELSSHTYHHVDVTNITRDVIVQELRLSRKRFADEFGVEVVGFHPPQDRWSIPLLQAMKLTEYQYLIARDNNPQHWHAHLLKLPFVDQRLCIPSIADDWDYFDNHMVPEIMLRYWEERISMLGPGSVAAIGFHPWVLGASPERLSFFESLVTSLVADDSISLTSGRELLTHYQDQL